MSEIDPIYTELATRIGCEDSKYIPQILAKLANPEQARILREMPIKSKDELAKRLQMDLETVDKHVQELYEKGLVLYRLKGGLRSVYAVTELKDTTAANPKFDESLGNEFFNLWQAWFNNEALQWRKKMSLWTGPIPMSRVVAQWKSIKDIPDILACDDVRELLRVNKDTLAVNPCSCARIARMSGTSFPIIPEEICLVVKQTAQYCLDKGTGRKISFKEAIDIINQLEKYSLVHIVYNEKRLNRLVSSSDKRCVIYEFVPTIVKEMIAPSRFEATIKLDMCFGNECRKCVDICIFEAAQLRYYPDIGKERAYIDKEKCMGCGNCVIQCPVGALSMKSVRPPDFIPDEYVGPF